MTTDTEDEFTDPVLERTESSWLWPVRKALIVVFYESDENVDVSAWLTAYAVYLGVLVAITAPVVALSVSTEGAEATKSALTFSDMRATDLLEIVLIFVASNTALGALVTSGKFMNGRRLK